MNAIKFYRIANFCYLKKIPIIPRFVKNLIFLLFNSVVPYTCKIGKESKFAYGGIGVVLHSKSIIGDRVIIGQGVTIGKKLERGQAPTIGDRVYIGTGSKILGDVKVGNNVIIGANSVVTKDVPNNVIVAGAPATIIRKVEQDIYEILGEY
ncbi:serine acetyltransferase [Oceanobacillus sp. 143]|uniref:Serine acetyltransferase n=1 Tax=Oceanobacillus zhaokaii TaxID=2052660 RepID=A0A345PKE0_9BACI|nr:serine acetyltransferase [Oceanobacillus zhaokaii]AXI10470.1 serine acetyltransferase [Oceanobacillus zhaokaii]QGS69482.1 serine acetyltransferase [Oceanobacillus sp. 143]